MSLANRAAGIVFTDGKSILLLKRSGEDKYSGFWDLPGGHAEPNETELMNAEREAREELGLKKVPGTKFHHIHKTEGVKKYSIFLYKVDKRFNINLNKEHTDFEWVNFKNLNKKNIFPKLKSDIPKLLNIIKKSTRNFLEWSLLQDILLQIK